MIAFDLSCTNGHNFEGWFDSNDAFEEQKAQGLLTCPICGDGEIVKVLSPVKSLKPRGEDGPPPEKNDEATEGRIAMKAVKSFLEKNFDDVGIDFAKEALKIHYGAAPTRNIRGCSTEQEEDVLREEGVPFVKVPLPKNLD